MAAKVQVQLQHPAAKFANIKAFTTKKTEILSSSSPDPAYAKMICLKVLKGGALPVQLHHNKFLKGVRKEGRLCLATSLDPMFHTELIDHSPTASQLAL